MVPLPVLQTQGEEQPLPLAAGLLMSPAASPAGPTTSGHVTGLTLGSTPEEALSIGAWSGQDLLFAQ